MTCIYREFLVNFDLFALVVVNLLPEAQGGFRGVHLLDVAASQGRPVARLPHDGPTLGWNTQSLQDWLEHPEV